MSLRVISIASTYSDALAGFRKMMNDVFLPNTFAHNLIVMTSFELGLGLDGHLNQAQIVSRVKRIRVHEWKVNWMDKPLGTSHIKYSG